MGNYQLTQEEQEILDAFESGKIQPVPNAEEEIEKHRRYAAETLRKDKRISVRITSRDLSAIQKLAMSEGIPYQIFIAGVLHKFADGKYIEKRTDDTDPSASVIPGTGGFRHSRPE